MLCLLNYAKNSVSTIDKSMNNKNKNNSNCFDDSNF